MAVNGAQAQLTPLSLPSRALLLTGSYGFASTGEVSAGTDPSALTGQRGQPADATRQPIIVDDTALTGQSSHLAAIHGDTPMEVEMGPATAGPFSPPALPDQMGISLPVSLS